jgi:hypothetical protein
MRGLRLSPLLPLTDQIPQIHAYPSPNLAGLEMEERSQLTRIQLLSHQSKIASKMELFIGDGPNYEQARFERLGYLSLNNNQRSNYQARELKSVYISCTGRYLRLLIHRCYINKFNLFNQVRIHHHTKTHGYRHTPTYTRRDTATHGPGSVARSLAGWLKSSLSITP